MVGERMGLVLQLVIFYVRLQKINTTVHEFLHLSGFYGSQGKPRT